MTSDNDFKIICLYIMLILYIMLTYYAYIGRWLVAFNYIHCNYAPEFA